MINGKRKAIQIEEKTKNETAKKHFTFASSNLTLFDFVCGVQFNLSKEAEEGTDTQKEEEEEEEEEEPQGRKQTTPKTRRREKYKTKKGKQLKTAPQLELYFTQTLFNSSAKGTTENDSTTARKWREATQLKRRRSSTTHQKEKRQNQATPKRGGSERKTTQKERRDCNTTQVRKHRHTNQERTCNTNQNSTAKEGRRRKAAPPKMRRATDNFNSIYISSWCLSIELHYFVSCGVKLTKKRVKATPPRASP